MALPDSEKKNDKKDKPPTKVIIRRLPPTIDQETFLKQVSPIPDYNYIYTVNGDFSLGENAFSRVYVNFVNYEDVFNFKERFDNYVFLDGKGQEYPCVVEFASFQKIPKKRGKTRMDPKAATIESDPYYLEFLEVLKKPQEVVDEKPEYTLQLTTNENKNDLTTPLLEYIKNKRAQRMRIRELRREERKRKEFDKKRDYDRDDKKEKSPTKKTHPTKSDKPDEVEEKPEKEEKFFEKSYYKNKDRRFEDRKFEERRKEPKPRFPRKEYPSYKSDAPKEKKYEYKKEYESKTFPKKVKKYSEKREERKMEAQKAEQKKLEEAKADDKKQEGAAAAADSKRDKNTPNTSTEDAEKFRSEEWVEKSSKSKETESQNQRRIRNKDRPTIAIYRPGMLSKRKQTGEGECSDSKEKPEEK